MSRVITSAFLTDLKLDPVLEGNPRRCIVTACKIRTRHIRNEIINGYLAGVPQTLAVHNYRLFFYSRTTSGFYSPSYPAVFGRGIHRSNTYENDIFNHSMVWIYHNKRKAKIYQSCKNCFQNNRQRPRHQS